MVRTWRPFSSIGHSLFLRLSLRLFSSPSPHLLYMYCLSVFVYPLCLSVYLLVCLGVSLSVCLHVYLLIPCLLCSIPVLVTACLLVFCLPAPLSLYLCPMPVSPSIFLSCVIGISMLLVCLAAYRTPNYKLRLLSFFRSVSNVSWACPALTPRKSAPSWRGKSRWRTVWGTISGLSSPTWTASPMYVLYAWGRTVCSYLSSSPGIGHFGLSTVILSDILSVVREGGVELLPVTT